jgi:hypothetical protein
VPLYGRVAYQQVYPGIDLVFDGNSQQQLEYDLDLAPGGGFSASNACARSGGGDVAALYDSPGGNVFGAGLS